MLMEIPNVRQVEGDPKRRWFRSNQLDLIVWYSESGGIIGFQLCYNRGPEERALTWFEKKGFSHNRVDDGESKNRHKMTPILVRDGVLDKEGLLKSFDAESAGVDTAVADIVRRKIREFEQSGPSS